MIMTQIMTRIMNSVGFMMSDEVMNCSSHTPMGCFPSVMIPTKQLNILPSSIAVMIPNVTLIRTLQNNISYSHDPKFILSILNYGLLFVAIVSLIKIYINRRKFKKEIDKIPGFPSVGFANMTFLKTIAQSAMARGITDPGEATLSLAGALCSIEPYKSEGIMRIWLGPIPVVVVFKPEFVEVSCYHVMCYKNSNNSFTTAHSEQQQPDNQSILL